MTVIVRQALPTDAAVIARLNAINNDLRSTQAHIANHIATASQFETAFLAEFDGAVAGMACLRLLPCVCDPTPYAELTELLVDPAYRRRGVGRALVEHIEALARSQGASELVLTTAWGNTQAHAFYHSLGYRLYTVMMRHRLVGEPGL